MKKLVAGMLCVTLLLCFSTALAAGKISVTQENFYAINVYSDYGFAFAKVKNVGNKPIKINAGILEIFDEDGDSITSTDNLHSYAEYLAPDEYTYVYMSSEIEDDQMEQVDDYLLTITGKSDNNYVTKRLTVKDTSFERDVQLSRYSSYDFAYFTIVNDTDETIWGIKIVYALLDDNDNILYVGNDSIDSNQGLASGSTMYIRESIGDKYMSYYDANGLVPTKVDAIAYVNVSTEK